jgi:adenylate cyclase
LAHHWEAAGEALAAVNWHRRAAEWVGARDRSEMSRHWQRVRALLDAVPQSSETLAIGVVARTYLLQNGMGLGQTDDEAAALFAEGMALAGRLDSPAPRILLLGAYGSSRLASGAMDEALAHLAEGLSLADQSGNTLLQFIAQASLATALPFAGQLREAVAMSDEVERLCGAIRSWWPTVDAALRSRPRLSRGRAGRLGRLGEAAATAGVP